MFHCKNDGVDNGLEHLALQLKHTLSAMEDDIVHKLEEWLSKLGIADEIIRDHFQSWLTETAEDVYKEPC